MDHEDDEVATHFAYVKWEDLYLWPLFQRDVAPSHVRKILGDFEPTAVITACAIKMTIDGKVHYILWDGHHTVQTCRLKGYSVFPISYVDIDQVSQETIDKARLSKLVEEMNDGVDTIIGERGMRLSGGQRQRIALARAFYHERNVLVMDESTSALDTGTEKEIVEEIKRLKGQKTLLVIAHRLSTLKHCDKIIEIENGKIINCGNYKDIVLSKESK